jgi:hypothetical protein
MSIRDSLRTAGRVGYQVLDNIIGFDDDYDTMGELLARSLREDPLGTAGSIAGGLYEGAKGAVTQPVQTAREVADEFADAYFRLREGLPEDATRDDIGQLTEDLTLFGSLVPAVGATARTVRATTRAAPEAELDPWSNVDFDDGSEPPEDWLDDLVFGQDPDADLAAAQARRIEQENLVNAQAAARADQLLARRDALIAALGGEASYQNALRGGFDMDPADFDEAGNNLGNFPVLERTVFDPEDGPQPDQYTVGMLAAMNPDAVRALATQIENDPTGSVYSPELVDMLADMTPQELSEITGLPIAGAGTGFQQTPFDPNDIFQQTPFDPNDIDFGPDMDQIAAGGTNPWTNVQGAEDLAAAYVPGDPYSSIYGRGVPDIGSNSILFSPTTRAAVSLEQPRYGSVDEVISNLRRQGATSMEIDLLRDQGVFDGLASEAELTGAIAKDSVIEAVGSAPRLNRSDFTVGRGAQYQSFFPPGAENYRESVFSFAQQPSAYSGPYYQSHFEQVPNAVFHMRTGELPTQEGGRAFHVGEIQSDLSKEFRGILQDERDFNRPLDMSPLEWRMSVLQRKGDREAELLKLDEEINRITGDYPDEVDPDEIDVLRREQTHLSNLIKRDNDILQQMIDEGDATQSFGLSTYSSRFEGGNATEVTGPIPIARDTNDYNTVAIARAFADAAESGADFLTFNTGDMMYQFSGGRLSGQRKAYDDILPRNLENYARRLAEEYDIDPPAIERVTLEGPNEDYNVPGIRITPELRALIQTQGLPSYKNGGIVSLLNN